MILLDVTESDQRWNTQAMTWRCDYRLLVKFVL